MFTDKEQAPTVYNSLFEENPNNVPDNHKLYFSNEKSITFSEVRDSIRKYAYNIQKRFNIQKSDVVAIRSSMNTEYSIALHGTVYAGGTVALVMCSPEDDAEKVAQDLETVKPKLFIIEPQSYDVSLEAADKAGIPRSNVLVFGGENVEETCNVKDILFSGNTFGVPYKYSYDEFETSPAYLLFTSGSTGRRKAVSVTQKAFYTALKSIPRQENRPIMRTLSTRPAHFASTIFSEMMVCILLGSEVYISKVKTAEELFQQIEKHRISDVKASPYVWAQIAKDDELLKYDVSSLRATGSVGAVLPKLVIQHIKQRFGFTVMNIYGATEIFAAFQNTPTLSEQGALGSLRPGCNIRIVDGDDNDVQNGEPGELLVKGPMVTKGYYNSPEENVGAFSKDGFFRTGDLIIRDDLGVFWYISRIKNLIKYQSNLIYPYDIEKVLITHPKVADCGVIGNYSEELLTDLPRAYLTLVNKKDYINKEELEKEILEYANNRLQESKQIRDGVFIIENLPRTLTGKIIYNDLKKYAQTQRK